MAGDAQHLLVIEDEKSLRTGLTLNLGLEGYRVSSAATLREAHQALAESSVDLIILDLMLPDGSGLAFCEELRSRRDFTPILILTAKSNAVDVVEGLESGADDYLTKPFNLGELLSRVRVTLRRRRWDSSQDAEPEQTLIGDTVVHWDAHELERDGQTRRMTGLEVRLLGHFVENAGRTLTREELLHDVWGLSGYQTRTVDNFVARMRKYFEPDPSEPRYFLTVRGAGYRFEP